MGDGRFETFEEFWPFYLGEHKDPRSRALHYMGTSMAIGTVATAALTLNPAWLLLTPVVGYTPAWIGHFIIEKNRPATFKYPVWSLRGDFRMLSLALAGRIAEEMERHHPKAGTAKVAEAASRDNGSENGVTNGVPHVNGVAEHSPAATA